MKLFLGVLLTAALVCLCEAGAAQSVSTDPVPVYDSTAIALDHYTVVRRLGIDSWRSAFEIPGHRDEAGARRAVLSEAARVGADGVINLHCLSQTDAIFNPSGYYCYGNAIRLRNERRVTVREATTDKVKE